MFNLLVLVAVFANSVLPLSTISVKGAKFFAGGQQFFLKGEQYIQLVFKFSNA